MPGILLNAEEGLLDIRAVLMNEQVHCALCMSCRKKCIQNNFQMVQEVVFYEIGTRVCLFQINTSFVH